MEILQDYLVVIVVGICLATGYIIKHSLDFVPNKYIPLIMGVLGVDERLIEWLDVYTRNLIRWPSK